MPPDLEQTQVRRFLIWICGSCGRPLGDQGGEGCINPHHGASERVEVAEIAPIVEGLREIADTDPVDNALDPQRPARIASALLSSLTDTDPHTEQARSQGGDER